MIGLSDCRLPLKASSSEFTKISVVLFNALVLDNIWWNLFRHWEHFLLFLSLLSCPHCPLMAARLGLLLSAEPARTGPNRPHQGQGSAALSSQSPCWCLGAATSYKKGWRKGRQGDFSVFLRLQGLTVSRLHTQLSFGMLQNLLFVLNPLKAASSV